MGRIVLIFVCLTIAYVKTGNVTTMAETPSASVKECLSYSSVGVLKVGEEKTVKGTCTIAKCNEDGSIGVLGCPSEFAPPECVLKPEDLSKLYPDCCPYYVCPK